MQGMLTVAILMPSGVDINDGVKATVADNQKQLIVSVKWPVLMTDTEKMHKPWKEEESYPRWWNSKVHGFFRYFHF